MPELRSSRPPYRTRNPGIPGSAFHSPKYAILVPPPENAPQKSITWFKKWHFVAFMCTFRVLSDHLSDFWAIFLGPKWPALYLEIGLSGIPFCAGSGRSQSQRLILNVRSCIFYVLREAKPGGFQTGGFPTLIGKGPDCVADPFGTVPRRCC